MTKEANIITKVIKLSLAIINYFFYTPTDCSDKFLPTTSLISIHKSHHTITTSVWKVLVSAPGASEFAPALRMGSYRQMVLV